VVTSCEDACAPRERMGFCFEARLHNGQIAAVQSAITFCYSMNVYVGSGLTSGKVLSMLAASGSKPFVRSEIFPISTIMVNSISC